MTSDPTVYGTIQGPSELVPTGALRDWTMLDKIHLIDVPTLLINGRYDEAQDLCMRPFAQHIKRVRWITLEQSSHMSHFEQPERNMEAVESFLTEK